MKTSAPAPSRPGSFPTRNCGESPRPFLDVHIGNVQIVHEKKTIVLEVSALIRDISQVYRLVGTGQSSCTTATTYDVAATQREWIESLQRLSFLTRFMRKHPFVLVIRLELFF